MQSKLRKAPIGPHPLLAQIPLTVSPFISLPTATTLPYTYKALPSTLPPSSTADAQGVEREKYVISASGHAAHPNEIIASCQGLQEHLKKLQDDAEKTLKDWNESLRQQDLAEKRRVAPGWLDRDEKILEPEKQQVTVDTGRSNFTSNTNLMDSEDERPPIAASASAPPDTAGEDLDRAFGGMGLR